MAQALSTLQTTLNDCVRRNRWRAASFRTSAFRTFAAPSAARAARALSKAAGSGDGGGCTTLFSTAPPALMNVSTGTSAGTRPCATRFSLRFWPSFAKEKPPGFFGGLASTRPSAFASRLRVRFSLPSMVRTRFAGRAAPRCVLPNDRFAPGSRLNVWQPAGLTCKRPDKQHSH